MPNNRRKTAFWRARNSKTPAREEGEARGFVVTLSAGAIIVTPVVNSGVRCASGLGGNCRTTWNGSCRNLVPRTFRPWVPPPPLLVKHTETTLIMRSLFRSGIYLVLVAAMTFPAHSRRATRALAFRKGSTFFVSLSVFPVSLSSDSFLVTRTPDWIRFWVPDEFGSAAKFWPLLKKNIYRWAQ